MKVSFNYIRNRISEHSIDDLLEFSYNLLESQKKEVFPIWYVFVLMKWSMIYGGKKRPPKKLTNEKYGNIYNSITNLNQEHITSFIRDSQIDKMFQILYNQQFYLQKKVYKDILYTQYKLYLSVKGKYDIEKSFKDKTNLSIHDFLFILQLFWLYININQLKKDNIFFEGLIDSAFVDAAKKIVDENKILSFIKLLTIHPYNSNSCINNYKHLIRNEDLQTMEMSFFTMFPFQLFKNKLRLVHESVFNYCANYYIYDFLKSKDENFTTEFGYRIESFFELGLKEANISYKTESQLKQLLPAKSKLVDFALLEDNIYIECKATELQAYPFVNPTDELLYNALKSSIFKAYFEQIVSVSKKMSHDKENWGIIITYKEFFCSHFTKLYEVGVKNYPNIDTSHIPAENIFIIDIYTWNVIVQIMITKKITLLQILREARQSNMDPSTSKMLFQMHLDKYNLGKLNLRYFDDIHPLFDIKDKRYT